MDQYEFNNIIEKCADLTLAYKVSNVHNDWRQYSEQLDEFRGLLNELDDISQPNEQGYTLIHVAAMEGHTHALSELMKAGADINNPHALTGATPLHTAIFENRNAAVVELIDRGADVNATDKMGHNALHLAASYDNKAVALLILQRGGDATAQNKDGDIPANLAMRPELNETLNKAHAQQQRGKIADAIGEVEAAPVQKRRM